MQKLKGSFVAKGDDGKDYIIEIYVDLVDVGTHDDPNATIEGLKTLQTEDGLKINRIGKGEYKLIQTGLRLHSISPDAP
jgi:hypothetical protein